MTKCCRTRQQFNLVKTGSQFILIYIAGVWNNGVTRPRPAWVQISMRIEKLDIL